MLGGRSRLSSMKKRIQVASLSSSTAVIEQTIPDRSHSRSPLVASRPIDPLGNAETAKNSSLTPSLLFALSKVPVSPAFARSLLLILEQLPFLLTASESH